MRYRKITPDNDNVSRLSGNALQLLLMPVRARAIALQCGSEHIAGLLELHARLCERNLEASILDKG